MVSSKDYVEILHVSSTEFQEKRSCKIFIKQKNTLDQ